jgi:hypothetical protein
MLTLNTYDSHVLSTFGGVPASGSAFVEFLAAKIIEFAREARIPENKIYWDIVQKSDWCKGHLVLYAKVHHNWEPLATTRIVGRTTSDIGFTFSNLLESMQGGFYVKNFPPESPHELFHSR